MHCFVGTLQRAINYNHSHARGKNGRTLAHQQITYEPNVYPPNVNFFGRPYFGPLRVLPPRIFTHTTEWPRLVNAHDIGGSVPKQFFNNKNSKIGPKFAVFWLIALKLVRITHQTFPPSVYDSLGINFAGPAAVKFWWQKNAENSARFRTTLHFDREYLRNRQRYRQA